MTDVEKERPKPVKWACITIHRWLPSRTEQLAGARAWGAYEDYLTGEDASTTFIDDVRKLKRTTKYVDKLPERAALLAYLGERKLPDLVFFRSPLCVGFSASHAQETVEAIWAAGSLVYVQTLDLLLRRGDDLSEMLAQITREAKTKHQSDWRGRQG